MRGSQTGNTGASPEDIMRKMFLRWSLHRLSLNGSPPPMRDLRDLFRSNHLVALAEAATGEEVPGKVNAAMPHEHETNFEAVVKFVGARTRIEWGEAKMIGGLKGKQMGFLEIMCWHLVELGLLKPLGLPYGGESLAPLASAIEQRLGKFIQLKQFHFRFTKEMIFAIVNDCSSWEPNKAMNDVQNLRAAFENIEGWGIPTLVDPEDVKSMGSVNERGFLLFFAFFIPSLEGIAGPKKEKKSIAPPVDNSGEIARLMQALTEMSEENEALKAQLSEKDASLSSASSALEAERAKAAETERATENERTKCHADIETLKSEKAARDEEIKRLERDLEGHATRGKENLSAMDELRDQLAAAEAREGETANELERVKQELAGQQGDNTAHVAELTRLNQELAAKTEQEQKLAAEIARLKDQLVATKKSSQSQFSSVLAALKEEITELRQSNKTLTEENERLKAQLEQETAERDQLKTKMESQQFDALEEKQKMLLAELFVTKTKLAGARSETDRTQKMMHALELKMPIFMRQGKNTVEPPEGDVTLVFTDVEGSTVQWEWDADSMAPAIRAHNDLMRDKLVEHGGYEVKTEGDAFMVAFSDPAVAVDWCLDVQQALLDVQWPENIYNHEKSQIVTSDSGKMLYKGLRVRMGIHCGKPSAEADPVTGRMDYFGPMVNRSARVESVANGGQIVMSSAVYDRVKGGLEDHRFRPEIKDLGDFELKGLNEKTHILQILPEALAERSFKPVKSKESELNEEKASLEKELAELRKKNDALADQLTELDRNVKSQIDSATALLADVQASKDDGQPPKELLSKLRLQLLNLVEGQTETASELQRAQQVNEVLYREANEAADRRVALALKTVENEKITLAEELAEAQNELKHFKHVDSQLESVSAEGKALREQLTVTTNSLKDSEQEAAALKEQLEVYEGRIREMESSLEVAQGDSEKVRFLKSLQEAMARRIESLEKENNSSRERTAKLSVILKEEGDRWAVEEKEYKKEIKELEARIRKQRAKRLQSSSKR